MIEKKEILKVSTALKEINKRTELRYKEITVNEVAEEAGLSREQLSRLSTDSKFGTIYNIASSIKDCISKRSIDLANSYNILYIITLMSEDITFFLYQ